MPLDKEKLSAKVNNVHYVVVQACEFMLESCKKANFEQAKDLSEKLLTASNELKIFLQQSLKSEEEIPQSPKEETAQKPISNVELFTGLSVLFGSLGTVAESLSQIGKPQNNKK